jgi:hypothetical protein
MQRGVNFKFKKLLKVEAKYENILEYESGAQMSTSDGKNHRLKICRYCSFNQNSKQFYTYFLYNKHSYI